MTGPYTRRIGQAQYTAYRATVQTVRMSDQHERLREARVRAGYESAAAAARAMQVPEGRYAHHENGTRCFRYDTAERYAAFFRTTPEWLMGGKQRHAAEGGPRQTREVTRLSWVAAGRLGPVAPIESVSSEGRFRCDDLPSGDWVALEVRGNSMDRIAPEGSAILVNRSDRELVSGRYYVLIASDGEGVFKRYRSRPDRFTPFTLDPDEEPIYPELEPDRGWAVFGRVRRILINV